MIKENQHIESILKFNEDDIERLKFSQKIINYSIIIPHKNIPQLLQRCLDSIPRREDVQIIVVDDNSDADKVDFANFPGLNDPYVEVVFGKNENGRKGAGYARNLGLEHAKGKWLVFADADDFFTPCFEDTLNRYLDDVNDIVYFKATSVDSQSLSEGNRHHGLNKLLDEITKSENWDLAIGTNVPWAKFVKRELVKKNHIYFQEVQYGNDVLFSVKTAVAAKNKRISETEIYCITYRFESLHGLDTIESLKTRFKVACRAVRYLKKHGKESYLIKDIDDAWFKILKLHNSPKELLWLLLHLISRFGFSFSKKYIKSYLRM